MSQARLSSKIAIKLSLLLIALNIQIERLTKIKKIEKESRTCGETFKTLIGSRKMKSHLTLNFRNDKS